jgi:phage FluMu protein Com
MSEYANHPVMQRFEGFLGKIYARQQEIMTEAEEGLRGLLDQGPTDIGPYSNALSGLEHRYRQLRDRLESTWDEQIESTFEEADMLDAGLDRKADAVLDLDARWAKWQATQAANFYRNLAPIAQAQMAPQVFCTQCGSPLQNPDPLQLVNIACPGCSAINQVAPTEAVALFNGAGHAYAEEKCVEIRAQIERFRHEVDLWRRDRDWCSEPLDSLEKWEQWERHYWTTYAQIVAESSGKPVDQALIDARMIQFMKYTLEMDQTWVRAKGRCAG